MVTEAQVGDRRRGNELGYKNNTWHIYVECGECGKGRWAQDNRHALMPKKCKDCATKDAARRWV